MLIKEAMRLCGLVDFVDQFEDLQKKIREAKGNPEPPAPDEEAVTDHVQETGDGTGN